MGHTDWANSATWPALRLLHDHDLIFNPATIRVNLEDQMERPPSRSTITRALEELLSRGYIEKPIDGAYYRITESGRELYESAGDG